MKPEHILVIRLSAMGDVAMTIPVLQQVLRQNPSLRITVLTQPAFFPLFDSLERVTLHPALLKSRHKGIIGLFSLYRNLKKEYHFDAVADLHDVLRSKLLRWWLGMAGLKTAVIDKGREEKKQLTAKKNKRLVPLKTSFQRYADVFNALGLNCTLSETLIPLKKRSWPGIALSPPSSHDKNICIAPFAKHREKTYPPEKMKAVIGALSKEKHCRVFLLGGKDEAAVLQSWEKEFPGVINIAGRFSFFDELSILSNMDLVISMDSANMHLASLFGVPVVSIWGATHPFAGFYGWSQDVANAVHIDLYCRPCSVFGNKPCYRGDHACMKNLEEERIVARTLEILS